MLFTLEPLKAAEGDCVLLHWGTGADAKLAVIDGGPGTFGRLACYRAWRRSSTVGT